jgi:hypothetical protein
MENQKQKSILLDENAICCRSAIPVLSLIAGVLIISSGFAAILTYDFYSKETLNWQVQSLGQDYINVFLIGPFLIITSFLAYKKSGVLPLWAGATIYIIYTYIIFCFDVKFNSLFIIYCLILGMSFYSLLYFVYTSLGKGKAEHNTFHKITSVYLMVIAVIFYVLWLSELLPSIINGTIPKTLIDAGLSTNPVHAIDLSVALPGIFLSGLFLFRKNYIGYVTAPIVLVFCILMDITIGFLAMYMKFRGIESDISITIIMGVLAVISIILLIPFMKQNAQVNEKNIYYSSNDNYTGIFICR